MSGGLADSIDRWTPRIAAAGTELGEGVANAIDRIAGEGIDVGIGVADALDRISAALLDDIEEELDDAMRSGRLDAHERELVRLARETAVALRDGTRADVERAKRALEATRARDPRRGER